MSDDAPSRVKNQRKEALAYFFATGGKYGFRKEPPTDSEYNILVKALAVTSILHYFNAEQLPILNLVQVRRRYGLRTEDLMIQNHLIHAQAILGYTPCVGNYLGARDLISKGSPRLPALVAKIAQIVRDCYVSPLSSLSTRRPERELVQSFVDGANKFVIQPIVLVLNPDNPEEINDSDMVKMKDFFRQALSSKPSTGKTIKAPMTSMAEEYKIKGVVLNNGATVARTNDGRISTNMFGGTMTGKRINFNGFLLDGGWTDDELLAAMQRIGVAEVLYA